MSQFEFFTEVSGAAQLARVADEAGRPRVSEVRRRRIYSGAAPAMMGTPA
jgi:hypothetical protein